MTALRPVEAVHYMMPLHYLLAFILTADIVFTLAAVGACDNFITPGETALGVSVVSFIVWLAGKAVLSGRYRLPRINVPLVFLLLWVAAEFVASLLSTHPQYSLGEMKLLFVYAAVAVAAAATKKQNRRDAEYFYIVIAVAVLAMSAHGILQYFGYDIMPAQSRYALSPLRHDRVYSIFGNSALFAEFLSVAAAGLLFAALEKSNSIRVRLISAIAVLLAAVCIIMTASRTAILAVGCAAIFIAVYRIIITESVVRRLGAAMIIIVFTAAVGFAVARQHGNAKNQSAQLRLLYWHYAVEMYRESPALGNGAGHFKLAYLDKQREYFSGPHLQRMEAAVLYEKPRHPHNEYLNILLEAGPAGLLFFIMIFVTGIGAALRKGAPPDGGAMGAMLAAFAAVSLLSMPLSVPVTGMLLALIAGAIGVPGATGADAGEPHALPVLFQKPYLKAVLIIIVAAVGAMLLSKQFNALEARIYLTKAKRAQPNLQHENAEQYARNVLRIYPRMGEAHFMLGVTELRLGRAEDALEQFALAGETSSDLNLEINTSLAMAAAGRIYDAIDVMKEVAAASPMDIRPRKILVKYYSQLGYYEDALEEMKTVMKFEGKREENINAYKQLEKLVDETRGGGSEGTAR